MTGWRLGTLQLHLKSRKAVASMQSQTSSNATTFAQFEPLQNGELGSIHESCKGNADSF